MFQTCPLIGAFKLSNFKFRNCLTQFMPLFFFHRKWHRKWLLAWNELILKLIDGLLKLYGPFLWMGFNCLKTTKPIRGDSLLFTNTTPGVGTHLIDVERMKGWERLPGDFEPGALTTRLLPLLKLLCESCSSYSICFKFIWLCMTCYVIDRLI